MRTVQKAGPRPLLVYLQGILPSLNPTERLIAEFILSDPERILSSSIAEIRNGSGASVGSIVGFCRSLGLKGYANFKIALARELAQSGLPGSPESNGSRPAMSLFESVFHFHTKSLTETLKINRQETLQEASR